MEMSRQLTSKLRVLPFLVLLMACSAVGCSEDPPPAPAGTLSGTITTKGEICGNCRVAIHSETGGSVGRTVTESGTFEFKNVPFGDYRVTVYQAPSNDPAPTFDTRIRKKYRKAKTSGFKVSIPSGEPVVYDLEMN